MAADPADGAGDTAKLDNWPLTPLHRAVEMCFKNLDFKVFFKQKKPQKSTFKVFKGLFEKT